jgi:large subunit ribosomal protein L21
MYAVFVDGSRQYRVKEGDLVKVDFREAQPGERVEFGRVILLKGDGAAECGAPALAGFRVIGEVHEQTSTKLYVQHFRRRKNYRRLKGHRQPYTMVRIKHILRSGQEPPAAAPKSEAPAAAGS